MNRIEIVLAAVLAVIFTLTQCKRDDDISPEDCSTTVTGKFNFNQFPLPNLSDYDFFIGDMKEQNVTDDILPYDVITPLFSDYAHKKRFIWMPEDAKATYNVDSELLDMPDETIIIKTFYYDNVQPSNETQLIETRLLYKLNGEWKFADYIWNDDQEEAAFDLNGQNKDLEFINDDGELISLTYRIPSETECFTCHKVTNDALPIGPKPQNLNKTYSYSDGALNQLEKWVDFGFLEDDLPASIETVADWTDESLPKLDRVRAYLDMNCAHCHREDSHCSYRPMRFAWNETVLMENLGLCIEPAEPIDPFQTYVVAPGNAARSMMYFRMNTTEASQRMPLMGRTIIHQESIDLLGEWIDELEINCE